VAYDLIIVATLDASAQTLARLILDGVPKEKLFPLRQETVKRPQPADLVRSGNSHHG
jgi:hypothetical protein